MSTIIAILSLLLAFVSIGGSYLILVGGSEDYKEMFTVCIIILLSCTVFLLLNEAVVVNNMVMIGSGTLVSVAGTMFLSLVVSIIVQLCKSRFKEKWDMDAIFLLTLIVVGATGWFCMA